MYLMGIDLGTSSVKTAVFDERGRMLSLAAMPYVYDAPRPGYAEQNPELWWDAAAAAICESIRRLPGDPEDIKAVGFSGQMHGIVPLDKDGRPVRKAILHCDVRAKDTVEKLKEKFGEHRISDIVLNPVFPGFQMVSLCWMREHEPELYGRIKTVICPKDYIRYRMTGEIGTECTDASGTLLYDMRRESWSAKLFEMLNLNPGLVPFEIHSPYEAAGKILPEAARRTGLPEKTEIVYGGADQVMHSLGNGVYKPGTMMATVGTSGQVLTVSKAPVQSRELNVHCFRHAENHYWYGLAAVLHAGSTLNWFQRTFAKNQSFPDLSEMANQAEPCCDGLVFFPCMGGERTPYMDTETRGMFSGISMFHKEEHFARAMMEGVSFAVKTGIRKIEEIYGKAETLICAGGGVKGKTWAQIQADIYGREIFVSNISEQACLGAAVAAAIGGGIYKNAEEACAAMIRQPETVICPNTEYVKKYEDFFQEIYVPLYSQNREIFHRMNCF